MKNNFYRVNEEGDIQKSKHIKEKEKKKNDIPTDIDLLNLGFYLITPIIFGLFLGILLDKKFGKSPLFTVIMILFGAVGSLYNLFKLTKK